MYIAYKAYEHNGENISPEQIRVESDCIINVLGQSDTKLKFLFPVPGLDLFDDTISSL